MNPDEIERHIMNGSRAISLLLDRILAEADLSLPVAVTPPLMRRSLELGEDLNEIHTLTVMSDELRFKESANREREIELKLGNLGVRVPHGLIRDAWVTSGGGLGLCLDVAVVHWGEGHLVLEPVPR